MQVTLARALKLKKRIIERIEKYEEDITLSNRIIVGNIRDIDVNETMRLKKNLKDILINLKVKLREFKNLPFLKISSTSLVLALFFFLSILKLIKR